jgi:hypothetical protein
LKNDSIVINISIEDETIASPSIVPEIKKEDLEKRDLKDSLINSFS